MIAWEQTANKNVADGLVALNHDRTYRRRSFIPVNIRAGDRAGDSVFAIVVGCFSSRPIQKILGRSETRTRDRKCFQSIRTV